MARETARSNRCRNAIRLGSPVTGSRNACCAVASVRASDIATLTWSANVSRVRSSASVNVWSARNDTTTRLPTTAPFSCTGAAIAARAPRSTSCGTA